MVKHANDKGNTYFFQDRQEWCFVDLSKDAYLLLTKMKLEASEANMLIFGTHEIIL